MTALLALLAAAPAAEPPRLWAAVVALTKHDDSQWDNLQYADNDGRELRRTLLERAAEASPERVLYLADTEGDERRPTSANLRRELTAFLKRPAPQDRVLVFYAGHGTVHKGRTYLVTRDFDGERPEGTGVPIAELRAALEACPAQLKCLVLDCCHAGNDRSVARGSQSAEEVARGLGEVTPPGTVVLASSRADEKSYAWNRHRHGVFSFWLLRGLAGAAGDERGRVTLGRLNAYVFERTDATANLDYGKDQRPVLFGKIEGDPVLLTLRPESPESICTRMAEHLDLEIRRSKFKRVAVAEFLQPRADGEGLGPANLPAFCAAQVRAALTKIRGDDYAVLDEAQTRERLAGLKVASLGSPKGMLALRGDGSAPVDALVTGTLRPSGRYVQLDCRLYSAADGEFSEPFRGRLPLSEDALGDLGYSVNAVARPAGAPHDPAVVDAALASAAKPHPLLDEAFPFRVEVWGHHPRRGDFDDPKAWRRKEFVQIPDDRASPDAPRNDLAFAVRKGEVYQIRAWNRTGNRVAMHLLVDGLNTLNQTRDRLGQGAAWVLSPTPGDAPSLTCEGWFLPKGPGVVDTVEQTRVKRFQVTDVAESVAGRAGFGESIGTITAAFYAEAGRAVGTGEGPEERRALRTVAFRAGRQLGVVQLRYVDEREVGK